LARRAWRSALSQRRDRVVEVAEREHVVAGEDAVEDRVGEFVELGLEVLAVRRRRLLRALLHREDLGRLRGPLLLALPLGRPVAVGRPHAGRDEALAGGEEEPGRDAPAPSLNCTARHSVMTATPALLAA